MRKFTKEISALLTSAAITAAIGATTAASEEIQQTVDSNTNLGEESVTTATNYKVHTAGMVMSETTTEEMPPLAGEPLPSDEYIEQTETTTSAGLPSTSGEYKIIKVPEVAGDMAPADGDINDDGSFNVADVVTLQNYLINPQNIRLDKWYAADMCPDGQLNVFDLIMMKRELIDKDQFNAAPALLIRKDVNGIIQNTLITLNGSSYSQPAQQPSLLFEDMISNTINEGKKEEFILDTETLEELTAIYQNISKYNDSPIKTINLENSDENDNIISIVYKNENNELSEFFIFNTGKYFSYVDNEDIIAFIKTLVEHNYIEGNKILEYFDNNTNNEKKQISMSDIISLSKKGNNLSYADFEKYQYEDIGSGIYVRKFITDDGKFTLSLGSSNNYDIIYAYLSTVNGTEKIDIREDNVEEFYWEHNPPA